jgi:UDP-N-acetylglucosamine--N-acetylmuramyl-(pentapeptide) pyrophosphoryl-undecaprenol N-acetylglucosamine transferase
MTVFRAIIAGGGTGGHLFPGIAVAKELEKRFDQSRIVFLVGRRRMEMDILDRYGYEKQSIDVEGLKGRGLFRSAGVVTRLPRGFWQAARAIRQVSPRVILGVGGYTAGPVCLAGRFLGVPTAIHEQNSYPGLTNRILARVVNKVLISFDESREHFPSTTIALTGNPVREELLIPPCGEKKVSGRFTLLVLGGSQGARAVNTAAVDALVHLRERGLSLEVIHQTGYLDHERVKKKYREYAIEGDVLPFIKDMAGAYARADLVVSRAGATTLAELAALGKASILIPYPFAANQHQETNARVLERAGGAIVKREQDMSGEDLAKELIVLMEDPEKIKEMERSALTLGRPDAARRIVDQLLEMVS